MVSDSEHRRLQIVECPECGGFLSRAGERNGDDGDHAAHLDDLESFIWLNEKHVEDFPEVQRAMRPYREALTRGRELYSAHVTREQAVPDAEGPDGLPF